MDIRESVKTAKSIRNETSDRLEKSANVESAIMAATLFIIIIVTAFLLA